MPKLSRSDWYDLARDQNWDLSYVSYDDAYPEALAGGCDGELAQAKA